MNARGLRVDIDGLSLRYGRTDVLVDIDLHIEAGERLCLVEAERRLPDRVSGALFETTVKRLGEVPGGVEPGVPLLVESRDHDHRHAAEVGVGFIPLFGLLRPFFFNPRSCRVQGTLYDE